METDRWRQADLDGQIETGKSRRVDRDGISGRSVQAALTALEERTDGRAALTALEERTDGSRVGISLQPQYYSS